MSCVLACCFFAVYERWHMAHDGTTRRQDGTVELEPFIYHSRSTFYSC